MDIYESNRSFSDRLTALRAFDFSGYKLPSASQVSLDNNDIQSFDNHIPEDRLRVQVPLTRQAKHEDDNRSDESTSSLHRKTLIKSLLWPVVAVTVPIAMLAATLLGLVYGYRVKTDDSIFPSLADQGRGAGAEQGYVLVNYPATRLVFAASFLSTLAPLLGSFIMMLWSLRVAQSMRCASVKTEYDHLPTPYQLSLIVGLTLASTGRLRSYYDYLFSKSRPKIPPVVHHAAIMLSGSILLSGAVFVADSVLHYTTSTISYDQITPRAQPVDTSGRGLSPYCLDVKRADNAGFPCSYPAVVSDPNVIAESNEIFYLQHNTSQISEIRIVEVDELEHGNLAILTPQAQTLPPNTDYRASTIGVSTQCQLITKQCHLQAVNSTLWHTQFNCSDAFYGVLGKAPNISELIGRSEDPDLPPFGYKPASNLQYGFFTSQDLNAPYNPEGYDPATDELPSTENSSITPLSDSQLVNPMYLAIAGRFTDSSESVGSQLDSDNEIFTLADSYFDFTMSCPITAYDVDYTLVNGQIQDVSYSSSPNGSLLEIFHARQFYISVSGGGYDLEDYLSQAALQDTSEDLAREWADLYSTKVLATIGAYTSPRLNIQEQERTPLLVAKVPEAALGALLACSLAYTILGFGLGLAAYKASTTDVRDLAAQLSLPGLTAAAFEDRTATLSGSGSGMRSDSIFSEKLTRKSTRRVVVDGNPENGYEFRVLV